MYIKTSIKKPPIKNVYKNHQLKNIKKPPIKKHQGNIDQSPEIIST
jgi:hypothetical protein